MAVNCQQQGCLEDALLLEEVSLLLSAVEACTARVNPAQASSQLIREGFRNSLSLYKAAYRDLKMLRCQQELPMPVELEGLSQTGHRDDELVDLIGSTDNALGITDNLLTQALDSRLYPEAKGLYTDLLSEIELRLDDRRHWLSEVLESPGQLVEETAMMVSTLEASQQQHLATLLGLAEDMKYYMELLSGFLEQQAKFVTQCKLEKQKEIDKAQDSCLIAACKTHILKVQTIEQRLLAVTYTGQTLPALKAVSQHLDNAEVKAEAELEQVLAQVNQFEQLGPDFEALTMRYHKLLEDLRHAEYSLQEFQQEAVQL